MNMLIAGGDKRMKYAGIAARQHGWNVDFIGHAGENCNLNNNLPDKKYDVIHLAYPFSESGGSIPAPLCAEPIPLEEINRFISKDTFIFHGLHGQAFDEWLQKNNCAAYNPARDKRFVWTNSVLSAEGALYSLMQRSEKALCDMSCAVMGSGPFAKALALQCRGMNMNTTLCARSEEGRLWARRHGFAAYSLDELAKVRADVWFNTIPAMILSAQKLNEIMPCAYILELASAPYGVDINAALALGIQAWREPGIPGKYCPHSAGLALFEHVLKIMKG